MVPGHEIIGEVIAIGAGVSTVKIGDTVGVGCMVGSCQSCHYCHEHLEQYCESQAIFTYNSVDFDKTITKGGYASDIVVHENFVFAIPTHLDPAKAAPLLCAGITTYSPLKHWNIGKQDTVGIVGLGGLGHMAIKFARQMGAYVVMLTGNPNKQQDALRLGAHEVILMEDESTLAQHQNRFDFMLNTAPGLHNIDAYLALLKPQKTLCLLGISPEALSLSPGQIIFGRKQLAGSLIGGTTETQEMLQYCGTHNISCDVEVIAMSEINNAYERMLHGDVKYRFVIDMATLSDE